MEAVLRIRRGAEGLRRRERPERPFARRLRRCRGRAEAEDRQRRQGGPGPRALRTRTQKRRPSRARVRQDPTGRASRPLFALIEEGMRPKPVFSQRFLRKGPLVEETYRLFA